MGASFRQGLPRVRIWMFIIAGRPFWRMWMFPKRGEFPGGTG